eukprot:CAMPEP_0117672808 /NCGR_PEP_ID=MMETSP0804-20121206/14114_1 /TAXON_ID=1074897 /ORGANISM="Tetraselmis astigmatica, Strain CCMP880" /LENGTH=242 /DNA_ID=CAMNT_0005481459 /DNA_START=40 /DNA_END=768 /DNA_ORIENTATION=+
MAFAATSGILARPAATRAAAPSARAASSRFASSPLGMMAHRRPVASRRSCRLTVHASGSDGIDVERIKDTYSKVTKSVPPVVTAATVPVIGLSLLCKTLTGSGLPGTFLGSIEGLSYLVFLAGLGSFLPRASAIVGSRDFSLDSMMAILTDTKDYSDVTSALGDSATSRLNKLGKNASKSALGAQMADIEKARKLKQSETPSERAMKEKLKADLAAKALKFGQSQSEKDAKTAVDSDTQRYN